MSKINQITVRGTTYDVEPSIVDSLTVNALNDIETGLYTISSADVNAILAKMESGKYFDLFVSFIYDASDLNEKITLPAELVPFHSSGLDYLDIVVHNLGTVAPYNRLGIYCGSLRENQSCQLGLWSYETLQNKVQSIDAHYGHDKYPSAKAVYDFVLQNILNLTRTIVEQDTAFNICGDEGIYLIEQEGHTFYYWSPSQDLSPSQHGSLGNFDANFVVILHQFNSASISEVFAYIYGIYRPTGLLKIYQVKKTSSSNYAFVSKNIDDSDLASKKYVDAHVDDSINSLFFDGTTTEWNLLTPEQQAAYLFASVEDPIYDLTNEDRENLASILGDNSTIESDLTEEDALDITNEIIEGSE